MSNDQRVSTSTNQPQDDQNIRDIHALTPPRPPHRHLSSSLSVASEGALSDNFTTMSREFSALLHAGSAIAHHGSESDGNSSNFIVNNVLSSTGEEETNPYAIVPDSDPVALPTHATPSAPNPPMVEVSVQSVKKEEVETKIAAWQHAKVAEINNKFKREDAVINGWEDDRVQKATQRMKKVERKLEERKARALEKTQNDIARAHRKAEERRASAEAKRGTKVAGILDLANMMRAIGKAPSKRSFF